jgi:hypothetical protein
MEKERLAERAGNKEQYQRSTCILFNAVCRISGFYVSFITEFRRCGIQRCTHVLFVLCSTNPNRHCVAQFRPHLDIATPSSAPAHHCRNIAILLTGGSGPKPCCFKGISCLPLALILRCRFHLGLRLSKFRAAFSIRAISCCYYLEVKKMMVYYVVYRIIKAVDRLHYRQPSGMCPAHMKTIYTI